MAVVKVAWKLQSPFEHSRQTVVTTVTSRTLASKQHQQVIMLFRSSSCTIPLHWLPVMALPENVLPETVVPDVHSLSLQYNQIATPALSVKVLSSMLRPMLGPRLFWVFSPGVPLMLF